MGLVKRGNVWWMSLTFQGRRIRRSTGTANRHLAEAILGKVKAQIIEGRYFDIPEEQARTFKELMDRFEREHVVKLSSQRAYRGYLKHLRGFFGDRPLAEITPKLIVAYKIKRYEAGVKPATINREVACLKKAFSLAVREWEWCRENQASRVSMEREENKRDRWLTTEEQTRLLKACSPWLQEIVVFALHTGMRLGEILALTWKGVDLFRKTVTVVRSKNGERRTIPVNGTVLALLKEKFKVRRIDSDLVFPSREGTPLDGHDLRRAFRSALREAKIDDLHFHDLRHTFATRLVQAGVDIYKVQRLLGHKTGTMTQRYAHHHPESLRDGVAVLDRPTASDTKLAQSAEVAEVGVS